MSKPSWLALGRITGLVFVEGLALYNQHLPQRALGHQTPLQAMKQWQKDLPELFVKRVGNRPGLDTRYYRNQVSE